MATQAQIANSLRLQLSNDTPERLQQAGDNWRQPPMGFYYGNTPHSEISVDIAVRASMLRVLQAEGTNLPRQIWGGLSAMININTAVGDAIQIMTFAAAHAVSVIG
jgi:hypothetical protein